MTCVRVRACINVRLPLLYTTVQCADGGKITGITFADWGDPTAVEGSGPYDPHACEFKLNLQPTALHLGRAYKGGNRGAMCRQEQVHHRNSGPEPAGSVLWAPQACGCAGHWLQCHGAA